MTVEGTQTILPGPQASDDGALQRLLALAGPSDAPELMRRLEADLRDVCVGLAAGFSSRDPAAIRKHSHVLLAIAGTIGAKDIYHLAQALNRKAKDGECLAAEPETADLMQRLDVLIARLPVLASEPGVEG